MLPTVVRLRGRIDSLVIPALDRSLVRCGQAPYVILDLRAVDAVETSVVEYIQSQVKRYIQSQDEEYIQSQVGRIRQRHAPLLKLVVPHSQLTVMDLARGKVNYGRQPAMSPVAGVPASVDAQPLLAYETLEDAIRDARYGDVSSSCLPTAKPDASFDALSEVIFPQQTSSKLEFILPQLPSAGLMVRKLERGETIACSEYPFQPSFVILEGVVDVRQLHAAPVDGASRKCVRKAVLLAVKAIFQRKTQTKVDRPTMMEGTPGGVRPKVVAPRFPFCARVMSESCWILEIDPTHVPRWDEIVERARQSGAMEDMK
jgi:hypothetical protein